ncbi:hypothetical protein [Marinobacterium aestuariivivens]|uniref:EamA domain-containing protein n=1 Tax=Marinobacterium aestuariivivens TaxID=1698799 RepID=A0ABW2A0E4_9GAMM
MNDDRNVWAAYGSTSLFVLLWASGAIFTRWGLDHASSFAFLIFRFVLAIVVLGLVGIWYRRRLAPGPAAASGSD